MQQNKIGKFKSWEILHTINMSQSTHCRSHQELDHGLGQGPPVLYDVLRADGELVVDLVTGLLVITAQVKRVIQKEIEIKVK